MLLKENELHNVDFVQYLMKNGGHGNGLIIKGVVRSAKTTLLGLITKIVLENSNFAVISNVRFQNSVYDDYKNLYFINSLEMYLNYYSEIPYSMPILLVWDDSQATEGMTSKDVFSKAGKIFAQFLIWIGKLQTSYIYVAHQKYIPAPLTEGFEPLILYKLNRSQFILATEIYEKDSQAGKDINNIFVNLPKPDLELLEDGNYKISETDKNYLPIMTRAFTSFKFNVDMQKLNDKLTSFEVGENLKEGVKEFLNNSKNTDNPYFDLEKLSYEKLYIALCLKKGRELKSGETIRELFNPNILNESRKKYRKLV